MRAAMQQKGRQHRANEGDRLFGTGSNYSLPPAPQEPDRGGPGRGRHELPGPTSSELARRGARNARGAGPDAESSGFPSGPDEIALPSDVMDVFRALQAAGHQARDILSLGIRLAAGLPAVARDHTFDLTDVPDFRRAGENRFRNGGPR